jgi:hypothetical protein
VLTPPTAGASEPCHESSDHVAVCSFSSMERCEATLFGLGVDCLGDPSPNDDIATSNRDPYVYSPRPADGGRI